MSIRATFSYFQGMEGDMYLSRFAQNVTELRAKRN